GPRSRLAHRGLEAFDGRWRWQRGHQQRRLGAAAAARAPIGSLLLAIVARDLCIGALPGLCIACLALQARAGGVISPAAFFTGAALVARTTLAARIALATTAARGLDLAALLHQAKVN